MSQQAFSPVISVGVPTFNRPDGLKLTLDCITKQTYSNLEIIISDNCSSIDQVEAVARSFASKDRRITYIRQSENIGAANNFRFVAGKATGQYFIWAADDDQWLGNDFLAKLIKYADKHILTFPDALIKNPNNKCLRPLAIYKNCKSDFDYTRSFCTNGAGYPVYGLYNLDLFYRHKLEFKFDEDLQYYNEGTFLHELFLAGRVRYAHEARILFDTNSNKPPGNLLIDDFIEYFKRTLNIYSCSNLEPDQKSLIAKTLIRLYSNHCRELFNQYASELNIDGAAPNLRRTSFLSKLSRRLMRTMNAPWR